MVATTYNNGRDYSEIQKKFKWNSNENQWALAIAFEIDRIMTFERLKIDFVRYLKSWFCIDGAKIT